MVDVKAQHTQILVAIPGPLDDIFDNTSEEPFVRGPDGSTERPSVVVSSHEFGGGKDAFQKERLSGGGLLSTTL